MSREELPAPTAWVGWVFFAAAVMVLPGVFHIITGLVALLKDEYFSVRPSGLIVSVDYTTWGWTHLLMGVLLIGLWPKPLTDLMEPSIAQLAGQLAATKL